MKNKKAIQHCSLRLSQKELEGFLQKKFLRERNLMRLIVFAKILSILSLILTYVQEQF